jgi:hypothetical protein
MRERLIGEVVVEQPGDERTTQCRQEGCANALQALV